MNSRQTAALLIGALVWGASFLFIKVLLDGGVEPLGIAVGRCVLGLAATLPLLAFARAPFPDRRVWVGLAGLGVINMAIPWTLFPLAEQDVPSGVASVANAATPLWATIFTAFLLRADRLHGRQMLGLIVGFCGVLVLAAPDLSGFDAAAARGTGYILVATCLYGISVVVIRRWYGGVTAAQISVGQLVGAVVVLGAASLVTEPFAGAEMGFNEWGSLLALGVGGTGVAFVMYMWLVAEVGPIRASIVTYLIPPIGVFLGWLVLDEAIGWNLAAGLVLVIAGVALVQGVPLASLLARRRSSPAAAAAD